VGILLVGFVAGLAGEARVGAFLQLGGLIVAGGALGGGSGFGRLETGAGGQEQNSGEGEKNNTGRNACATTGRNACATTAGHARPPDHGIHIP